MNREEFFYLVPYIFALAISFGVFLYSWQHRRVRGADIYTWFVGGQTVTVLGFIFELISPGLQIKVLWDKFQWLTDSFLVFIPFLLFAVQFSGHKLRFPRLTWSIWLAFPILFTLLLFTDNMHHLIYPNPHLSTDYPFPDLQYDFTFVIYIYALIYVYSINLYGISLLIKRAVQPNNLYRAQYWTIAIGFLIPLVLGIFSLANIKITPQRDITPFSFALGNLIVAWGLFRYGLFDIVPIARGHIVESMIDPVFVLDANNRVVDINPAGIRALGKSGSDLIGHSAGEVFARWPTMASELEYLDVERKEIAIQEGDDTFYYDLNISSIYNQRQLLGRIIAARDITRYKTLESGYRILSEELEQHVKERTEELRQSAEHYRAVVENQTEFIVRWKPDRTRTFVNEAYRRYFGITREQALQLDFLSHIVEADREAVLRKTFRLISGAVEVETDIHRVIKSDGSIGWHEWTDQVIRDETGQIVEFQSVGRDITERKHAEEALRDSEAIYRKAIEVAGGVPYRQTYHYYEGFHLHISYDFIGEGIQQITGYRPEEITEDIWDSLVKETILTGDLSEYSWNEAIERVRSGSNPVWQCEHRIQTRHGGTRWIYEAAVELRNQDGMSYGSIGLYQDITARKQAEQALRESEERFAILSTATFEAIGLSEGQKIIDVNDQMLKMFGYTRDEMIGMDVTKLVAPESLGVVKQHQASGSDELYEHLSVKKDGTVFPVEVRPRTIPYKARFVRATVIRDITERKQAEEALRKSEERFSKAFQASPIIITIFRLADGMLIEVNETFEKASGYTREEALGRTALELGLWANPAERDLTINKLVKDGTLRNQEAQFRIKDGRIFIGLCSMELIELGGVRCALATIEDITERKQAEEALRKSEERFSKAFQTSPVIIVIFGIDNPGILEVNETFESVTGFSRQETIGRTAVEMGLWTIPAERDRLFSALKTGEKIRNAETQFHLRDGHTLICLLSADAIELDGALCGIAVLEDITERKRAEEALRKSEERFSKTFQASPIIITISQFNTGKLLEVNEAFERVMGYRREEVIGKTAVELGLWADPIERDRVMTVYQANGKLKNEELQFRTKLGYLITCNYSAELIELNGEQCSIAIVEDITERKKAEARILRLNRLYVTISEINQTIVHAQDKQSLFHEICRVAAEHGQFRMAWIGLIDPIDSIVKPSVFAGEELGYLENLTIELSDAVLGKGPTGTAIREGHCIICQDIANDPRMEVWREAALSRGYRSSAAVPLRENGKVVGALTVYAGELYGFDTEDEELLEQISLDVSFALDSINTEMKRKQTDDALRKQLAFDELMTSLLARFATCSYSEVDSNIVFGLQAIAEFLDSDLADLIILSKDKTSWNSSHRWAAPHILQAVKSSKLSIPVGKLTWGENQLLTGNAIIIKSLNDYPAEAESDRKFSEAQGVKSILTIPIRGLEELVFGCIDMVSYNRQIDWSESDVAHLKLIGDAIANLLDRKHAEENLADAYDTTLEGWAKALELRDKETEGHSRRVTETTVAVARTMGFTEEEIVHIRRGSILHDIGKMGIPDQILRKPGPLTDEERQIVMQHPGTAYNLLKQISYLEKALDIPHSHHEKWDGTGYPRGLKGEEIPLPARIFAIVDVWDALTSDRPYRKAWDREDVIQYVIDDSGKHFDPRVVDAFLVLFGKGEI